MEQLSTEIQLLRTFRHKNIVKLFASWIDEDKDIVNIIIEYFTSGSLRQYMLFLSFVPLLNVHTKHLSVFLFSTKLVTSCKLWHQVGESFKPPKTCTTVSWTFYNFYEKREQD
ncbi:hypothetical protein ZEAMMB73_Zm00001d044057 [Zea mays]|uniref:Protein kinase domain-containing protein n=2 Tax=Zea mays TaxID=4577 RepID=B4FJL1_MAIZE|nr:unknown [Zea mays]AQK60356.1 hypothetical protein ZEAMMB73_Zm00001d053790 [Zea mays]AQK60360.1 hypothetical protein ZEAMMB73_Zm00001d053790 [Zea mays]AQK60367.1 hypothetical protein ZEAMMB73_Zm00001d053790 [Zea mays]ONM25306.1 hypothetical protein ZEAMMB73_Zm00001d006862 [Zea mays]|eukprot:NP_001136631.1 uncharacterized protein LOC100216758 [Zea mays]